MTFPRLGDTASSAATNSQRPAMSVIPLEVGWQAENRPANPRVEGAQRGSGARRSTTDHEASIEATVAQPRQKFL